MTIKAIGRLSNPFIYDTETITIDEGLKELDERLNSRGRQGWKLHTIIRCEALRYFLVWEKLDYEGASVEG